MSIGVNVPRKDGQSKVNGQAAYVDDLSFDGMLYGVTLRSQIPHGKIRAIQFDPKFDWSSVVVVDHSDIPGQNIVTLIQRDQPFLAAQLIRHVNEPILLIAATSRKKAMEARTRIEIIVDELPSVTNLEKAATGVRLYGEDNLFKEIHIEKGDLPRGFAEADYIVERTYKTGLQEQMYIEPQGVIAVPGKDRISIYGSLQCPHYVVKALLPLLSFSHPDQVQVIQMVTGGGFGGKEEYPNLLAGHAALLAMKSECPVKMVYDRAEDILATTKRHPSIIRHKTGLKSDGTLTALAIEIDFDGGAYATLSEVVLSRGCIHAAGPYRCENIDIVGRAWATNNPPNGAFRGFGAPQTCFALERQIDLVAKTLGIDPLEVRRRNAMEPGDSTATGQVLTESVATHKCLEQAVKASDYIRKRSEYSKLLPKARIRRGIGLSLFFHGSGFTGDGENRIRGRAGLQVTPDGFIEILTSSTDIGQGTETIFAQMVAEELGIPVDLCRNAGVDTNRVPDSGPTVASRTCMIVGDLVRSAAAQLREDLIKWLAELENCNAEQITLVGGCFLLSGQRVASFQDLAKRACSEGGPASASKTYVQPEGLEWDEKTYQGQAYPVFSWGCDVAEVEIDLDTYEISVTRFTAAQDVGKAIHPVMVMGQIEGGSLQAIGYATMEEVLQKNGWIENHRMTNCLIPTALDAPAFETHIIEEPFSGGPFGAKGVGELPTDGGAPAVAAAIDHATGQRFDEIPVTPEKIELALNP